MKLNKTVKRIVALGTAATMLGATVLGAMAATDLSAYPKPMFIKDGKFNGLIVIGADADTQDMLGAMDIISSLQASTIGVSGSGSATVQTVGDVYEFAKTSDKLNMNESLSDIRPTVSKTQLPIVLADGTLTTAKGNKYDYEQTVDINSADVLQLFADKDYADKKPTVGIKIPRNAQVLQYSLEFTKNAKSDLGTAANSETDNWVDLEDRSIEILGETFDIISTSNASTSLDLMRGALKPTLEEGETQTYTINGKQYEVTCLIIEDTGDNKVKFKINGEVTDAMVQGDMYETADGTMIGLREVIPNEAGDVTQDMVEFYLGAKEIVLENHQELNIDDEDISNIDVNVTIDGTITANGISQIDLTWVADDELFITEDKNEVVMPGLESIKFYMDGFYKGKQEKVVLDPSSDDTMTLEAPLTNYDVALDILYSNVSESGIWSTIGSDDDAQLVTETCGPGVVVNMDTDEYFVVTRIDAENKDGQTEVLQLTKADETDGVTIKDYEGNVVAEDKKINKTFDVADMTLTVTDITDGVDFTFDLNDTTECVSARLVTKEGLVINLPTGVPTTAYGIRMREEDDNENLRSGEWIDVSLGFDADNESTVDFVTGDNVLSNNAMYATLDNSKVKVGYIIAGTVTSTVGSKITYDETADQASLEITYPGEETYGNLFLGSKASKVTVSAAGEAVAANKIEVGAAVLDTSLASYTSQNLLVIGGPAINRATASLMGKTYPAYGADSGIAENSGMIKLVEQADGTVAVIVAGWEAPDTQRACRVLAESDMYAMSGSEVAVTGTSMTDISVGVPA